MVFKANLRIYDNNLKILVNWHTSWKTLILNIKHGKIKTPIFRNSNYSCLTQKTPGSNNFMEAMQEICKNYYASLTLNFTGKFCHQTQFGSMRKKNHRAVLHM